MQDQLRQGLHLARHVRQGLGLLLQSQEGGLALLCQRERSQRGGGSVVQGAHRVRAVTAAERGHHTQQRRARHTRHRAAKSQAQAFDGLGQRRAHGGQIGRAFQRKHRALEGEDQAQEGAEHAQHHQEANQVRRERQARELAALLGDALAHCGLQRRGHPHQPILQAGERGWHVLQRLAQAFGGQGKALDLQGAQHIHAGNHQRHHQAQRARTSQRGCHAQDGQQTHGKHQGKKGSIHRRRNMHIRSGQVSPKARGLRLQACREWAADAGPTRRAGSAQIH